MSKDVIILFWTTAITVVLLIWTYLNPPYSGLPDYTIKPVKSVDLTTEEVIRIKEITR